METSSKLGNGGSTPAYFLPYSQQSSGKKDVKDVWCYNLDNEMNEIMRAVTRYPYIGMDTAFPGICFCMKDQQYMSSDYGIIRDNVNNLKLIQLGLTFCKEDGTVADDCPSWQFNFRFDPQSDICNSETIDLLKSAGINFSQHASQGIDPVRFGELLTMSGLVLNPAVTWITFHSLIDLAFLLRILTGCDLPEKASDFQSILSVFFPHLFDLKLLVANHQNYSGSIPKIARDLQVKEDRAVYQTADESRLTILLFFKIRELVYNSVIDDKLNGKLFYLQSTRFYHVCSFKQLLF